MKPEEAINPLAKAVLDAVVEEMMYHDGRIGTTKLDHVSAIEAFVRAGCPLLTDEAKRLLADATSGWSRSDETFQAMHDELDKKQKEIDEAKATLAATEWMRR